MTEMILFTVAAGLAAIGWLAAGVLSSPPPEPVRRPGVDYAPRHGRPVDPSQQLMDDLRAVERVQVGRALSGALICDPAAPARNLPVPAHTLSAYERMAAATVTAALAAGYLHATAAAIRAGGIRSYVARARLAAVQACLERGRHRMA